MKNLKQNCNVAICFALIVFATPLSFSLEGCANFDTTPTVSADATDQIITNAEKTTALARDTFNLFVHLERDNETELRAISPAIHAYATTIRAHGLDWVDSASGMIKKFKNNRSASNQLDLNGAIKTLLDAIQQSQQYITQAQTKKS